MESFATADLRHNRAELLGAFAALGARLMRAFHPAPERADVRSLELSAAMLSGGFAELLMETGGWRDTVDLEELVGHTVLLIRTAAALA